MKQFFREYIPICLGLTIVIKAIVMVWVILHAGIGLGPDEAQYWTWSQHLDWGYYSKPPGIAWQIWVGTTIFGNTELGVRAFSILFGALLPVLIYIAGRRSSLSQAAAFWGAFAFALCPIGILASLLAITDGGMIIFWTASCAYIAGKLEDERPNYYILGALIMCGAIFKWPIYVLWVAILIGFVYMPKMRSWSILGGFAVSLLGLLPSVYWNSEHEWATFRHVFATVSGGSGPAKTTGWYHGNLGEFIGAQVALVSPILFVVMVFAFWRLMKNRKTVAPGVRFCGSLTLGILFGGCLAAVAMKMQGNWAIFAYPTAFVVLGWYAGEIGVRAKRWIGGGVALSVALCAFVFALPALQSGAIQSDITIPYKISPFRHNVGWNHLSDALKKAGYDPEKDYLISDKYQNTSILSFYGLVQRRAFFINLHGIRKNQFSFWPGIEREGEGSRGFFVAIESMPQLNHALTTVADSYRQELTPYFDKVEVVGVFPLFSANGSVVKGALIIECKGYNGKVPEESGLY